MASVFHVIKIVVLYLIRWDAFTQCQQLTIIIRQRKYSTFLDSRFLIEHSFDDTTNDIAYLYISQATSIEDLDPLLHRAKNSLKALESMLTRPTAKGHN